MVEVRMEQVNYRSKTLFHEINSDDDELYFVIFADSWEDEPVSKVESKIIDVFVKYSNKFSIDDVDKAVLPYRYRDDEDEDNTITLRFCLKRKTKDIQINDLLTAKANGSIYGDIYLINSIKHVIYHLYDDRGLDIISSQKKPLEKLYVNYNHWILDGLTCSLSSIKRIKYSQLLDIIL
ncbi:DUF3885 domain-containing protein [Aneurinibacillus sp. Ricciae_BoGa-3]|nr:DUF3885 domain-containing protein [Aneurinibacillus sp. Ricciae_BoGa-3]WCK54083.1 DUF3885 domain-containing protein [Aneurinibacillus sp. Ricciae_BoGa-3]